MATGQNRFSNLVQLRGLALHIAAILIIAATVVHPQTAANTRQFRMGYFEAGSYPYHSRLRDEFDQQLKAILPDSVRAVFVPEGYRSGEWDRPTTRRMAGELANINSFDLIVAVGPWVVQDLLEAGFGKPIVAMHQLWPELKGLIDANGNPVARNLTVHSQPDKLEKDLRMLQLLVTVKKLGLLYFKSKDEPDNVLDEFIAIGNRLGFEVVTAEGYDNKGTFAFFKAYQNLDKEVDALYIPSLWGLDISMINQFLKGLKQDRIPAIVGEDRFLVERGAFATNSAYNIFSEARFNAFKTAQIVMGAAPAQLDVDFSGGTSLAVNESTAQSCRIDLSRRMYNEADVFLAEPTDETPVLSVSDAILRAVAFHPGFLAQYDALEAASQAAGQAYSQYLPQLYLEASGGYRDDNAVNNSRDELSNEFYATSLNLRQKLFSLETIRSIQVASREKDLQQVDVEGARVELERAVEKAFLNHLKAEELLNVFTRIRQLIDRNIEITGTQVFTEDADGYDLARWQTSRNKMTQTMIAARSNLRVAQILINVLLNYPTENRFVLRTERFAKKATAGFHDRIFERVSQEKQTDRISRLLTEYAVTNNTDIRRKQTLLGIQKSLLAQNKSRYFPSLDFRAKFKYADEQNDTPPPFKEEKDSWSVEGVLNFPLFLGTGRMRERGKLKAQLSELEYRRDQTLLEVGGKVHSGFTRLISFFDKLPISHRRLEQAHFNLNMVIEDYDAGNLGILNLLDAQDDLIEAELEVIANRYGFYETMSDLTGSLGWSTYETGTVFTDRLEQFINQ